MDEDDAIGDRLAKDGGRFRVEVLPNEGAAPKLRSGEALALQEAASENGLKASEVEPNDGASPVNSNGMVRELTVWLRSLHRVGPREWHRSRLSRRTADGSGVDRMAMSGVREWMERAKGPDGGCGRGAVA